MGHTISKSLVLLMATLGLVTGLGGAANAYSQTSVSLSGRDSEHIAQFRNFPSRPDLDNDDFDDIRDEIEDRRDDDNRWRSNRSARGRFNRR